MSADNDHTAKTKETFELERYKANAAYQVELLKATVAFEHAALKPLPLLNGGAIIAMLTFAGNTASATSPAINGPALKWAAVAWSAGLIASVLAIFSGYWSQHFFLKAAARERDADELRREGKPEQASAEQCRHERFADKGVITRRLAYFGAAVSLMAFIVGTAYGIVAVRLGAP